MKLEMGGKNFKILGGPPNPRFNLWHYDNVKKEIGPDRKSEKSNFKDIWFLCNRS